LFVKVGVKLASAMGMIHGVKMVAMCRMGMMCGQLDIVAAMMVGGLAVMFSGFLMVIGGLVVMLNELGFMRRHGGTFPLHGRCVRRSTLMGVNGKPWTLR
jgi:hypothetical protein